MAVALDQRDDGGERRWTRQGAVRREDQFTRAPEFRDEHDSDHLPMWGRFAAAWHGLSTGRRVVVASAVASALAVLSVVGGAGIFTTLDDFGRGVGTQPEAHGPLGAQGGDAVPLPAAPAPQDSLDGALLNRTSPSASPLPAPPESP